MLCVVTLLAAVFLPLASIGSAQEPRSTLPEPAGDVVLTVTGDIAVKNRGDAALFDRAMLEALETETIETSTLWTDGVHAYTGVPLDRLLDRLSVEEGTLYATALNDYAVEIPVSDAVEGGPIVAFAVDGEPMSVRDKGPLWIIYPFDANPDYRSEVIYSRSIWQLVRIEVESGP